MVPDDRDAVHRELRSIKRWLVVVAILLAGVTLGTLSDLNAAPTWLGAPLLVTVFGTLLGGPVYSSCRCSGNHQVLKCPPDRGRVGLS